MQNGKARIQSALRLLWQTYVFVSFIFSKYVSNAQSKFHIFHITMHLPLWDNSRVMIIRTNYESPWPLGLSRFYRIESGNEKVEDALHKIWNLNKACFVIDLNCSHWNAFVCTTFMTVAVRLSEHISLKSYNMLDMHLLDTHFLSFHHLLLFSRSFPLLLY